MKTNNTLCLLDSAPAGEIQSRYLRRDLDGDGVCTITFDRADSAANIFDCATLEELQAHLAWVAHTPGIRGLLLASAKNNIFVAGADVHALATIAGQPSAACGQELNALIELGQETFNQLAALPVPTVAAIHGACVGGGCELALACGYRLATDARATRIGLPEVQLGILPAWGGTTRLPRLIGLPKALEIILAGKTLTADRARQFGLVDKVVPREQLMEVARARLLHPPVLHRTGHRVSNNAVSAMLIHARATRDLVHKTRGNYPAPFEALDVATDGLSLPLEESLALEREAILRLVQTDACRQLLGLFLRKERAKRPVAAAPRLHRAAVIGAGVMGAGIAQWLSARGASVILRDVGLEQLVRGMSGVAALYEEAVQHHQLTPAEAQAGKDRIFAAATDLPMHDVDLVVEAATEKLALKQDIFRCLAAQTAPRTILATNTSALSVSALAGAISSPERVVGLHFFNPVHRMELVEVIAGVQTSPEVMARAVGYIRSVGKVPVVVKDAPGFIVNRVLMPYLAEAVRLFDVGAGAREIDEAMLDFGMPMGPLRLLDEIGIDVAAHVAGTLVTHFGARVQPPVLLDRMLGAGLLGRKSGRGFYDAAHDRPNHEVDVLRSVHRHTRFTHDELERRMALLMVNEAARCVEEGVASPADIDLAMVLGTGFAPFRGGPLAYADAYRLPSVVSVLESLAAHEPLFAPCALLKQMAAENRSFFPQKGVVA